MSEIESTRNQLNVIRAKYAEAADATLAAHHGTDSLRFRLAAAMDIIGSVLALNPEAQEADSSLIDDFVNSVSNVRTKVADAHTSLAQMATGADQNSPLGDMLSTSYIINGIASTTGEESNNGLPTEVELSTHIREAFIGLEGVHRALSFAHDGILSVNVNIPKELVGGMVSDIERYEQTL